MPSSSARVTAVASQFAAALDADDFDTAGTLLSDDCIYEARSGTIVGRQAICNSYKEASDWGNSNLDSLTYESKVGAATANRVAVLFVDRIVHRGYSHAYSCNQVLHLGADGAIFRIEHIELPGEREALANFLASIGLSRP